MNQRIVRNRRRKRAVITAETEEERYEHVSPFFIHIPKTAGNSLFRSLELGHHLSHKTALRIRHDMPKERWESVFKFAFVRNPWDQIVSWYMFHPQTKKLDFNDWVVKGLECHWGEDWIIKDQKNDPLDQWSYLTDQDDKILVNFIGRFENLQADYSRLCKKLHIVENKLIHANRTKHAHYREFYTKKSRDIVAGRYSKMIEFFDYEF